MSYLGTYPSYKGLFWFGSYISVCTVSTDPCLLRVLKKKIVFEFPCSSPSKLSLISKQKQSETLQYLIVLESSISTLSLSGSGQSCLVGGGLKKSIWLLYHKVTQQLLHIKAVCILCFLITLASLQRSQKHSIIDREFYASKFRTTSKEMIESTVFAPPTCRSYSLVLEAAQFISLADI